MGTPEFSVPILKSIHNSKHNILQVYTQPPKRKNRGQSINLTPIHKFSNENSIRVRCPDELSTDEEFNNLLPPLVLLRSIEKKALLENLKKLKFVLSKNLAA